MLWLDSADSVAPALPAVWLIPTGASPHNLAERSKLRRGTARHLLARQLGCAEEDVVIAHDPAGRPLLARPEASGLQLSFATRAGIVAVAMAPRPIGVDVERIEMEGTVPLDVLHPDERGFLDAAANALRPLAFARIWAAKEAYVKALGVGFRRAPESFAVSLLSEIAFRVTDPSRPTEASGHLRIMKNGGQDILAAAVIVLDEP
ncbi:4'-phosphopantetheinyl transferase superfamily protein [Bosea sp. F3-2]|uniref:4'-phosphopantetheinyl transferase family protein n=1 Tax=Bosea sp. F3-2 TaxID=2599640 RepID=UPI0011EBCBC5|nr:4'-phosphopantetheinyl transferase superfamily protein [Bosea sp. F3-2]QEL23198.1 4'-phosphopantetheinyl transferase superfamily protein [Bosea sp. F3-2]